MEIFVSNHSFNNKHGIKVGEDFKKHPSIHWLPKVHKKADKFRYNFYSRSCSTQELSVRMTLVLQATCIKTHVKSSVSKFMKTLGLIYYITPPTSFQPSHWLK